MFHDKMILAAVRLFYSGHRGQKKEKLSEVGTRTQGDAKRVIRGGKAFLKEEHRIGDQM